MVTPQDAELSLFSHFLVILQLKKDNDKKNTASCKKGGAKRLVHRVKWKLLLVLGLNSSNALVVQLTAVLEAWREECRLIPGCSAPSTRRCIFLLSLFSLPFVFF